ncbi:hypothetical protein HY605_03040 [Candidatus Peregrinibacteria bacterium]|nr:hypothetical protein [Candidatus Peregrinibacteria bacterium]
MPEDKKLPTLDEVDAYPAPELLVPRLEKEHGYSREEAENLLREAKRMLYLRAAGATGISPSIQVDDAWHAMLMFTRFYQDFADFIGRFVHHNPTPGPPDDGRLYAYTKESYREILGEEPDPRYWP